MEKHRITVFCIEYNKTAGEGATVLKSFPQPLTAAEEKYYVQKYTEGDLEAKLPGWEIIVGPREAVQLVKFLKDLEG